MSITTKLIAIAILMLTAAAILEPKSIDLVGVAIEPAMAPKSIRSILTTGYAYVDSPEAKELMQRLSREQAARARAP